MKTEILIVDLVVTGMVFIPYFLFIFIAKQHYRQIDKMFRTEAENYNLTINVKDRWNQNAIGIDYQKNKLLFVQGRNEEMEVELIDLSVITATRILPVFKKVKKNHKLEDQLESITLEFSLLTSASPIYLQLFDYQFIDSEFYEMQYAEKWNKIISSVIVKASGLKRVAS